MIAVLLAAPLTLVLQNTEPVRLDLAVQHGGGTFSCARTLPQGGKCSLAPMVPGPAKLIGSGGAAFEKEFTIGPRGGHLMLDHVGWTGTWIGLGLVAVGGGAVAYAASSHDSFTRDGILSGGACVLAAGLIATGVDLFREHGWRLTDAAELKPPDEVEEGDNMPAIP